MGPSHKYRGGVPGYKWANHKEQINKVMAEWLTRYEERIEETKAFLGAIRAGAPETPILFIMTHAEDNISELETQHIMDEMCTSPGSVRRVEDWVHIPFFSVHTRMPASADASASPQAREERGLVCEEIARSNKTRNDFPALLDCLSMPVEGAVKNKLIFHILSRKIVSQSLDQALQDFNPTAKSNLLQFAAPILLEPCFAGFVALFTMTVAEKACKRLGLIAEDGERIDMERAKEDLRKMESSGLYYSMFRGFFSLIPEALFGEIFTIAVMFGRGTAIAGVGGFFGVYVMTACVNNRMECKRWAEIAAVIRKHAFQIHMQWVVKNGNGIWCD